MRFVLVHGGFHGAWCWDRLIPELDKRGHTAVKVDHRDAVVDVIQAGDVLVGHSMGGFVTSMAADVAADRVHHVVYLAAGLPVEGQPMLASSAGGLLDSRDMFELTDDGRRIKFRTAEAAIGFFFNDCPPEVAQWACDMLTPQPPSVFAEPISVPRFWEAELPRSLILGRRDHAGGNKAAVQEMIARLGVDPHVDGHLALAIPQPAGQRADAGKCKLSSDRPKSS